jgi:hypothetical protein
VAPASLLDQWQLEIKRHAPGLRCAVYCGTGMCSSDAMHTRYVDADGDALLSTHGAQEQRRGAR